MKSPVITKSFLAAAMLLLSSAQAFASPISLDFMRVTSNSAVDVASQLHVTVYDQADALATLGKTISANDVVFTFKNSVGIKSNITEIYFDDSNLLGSQISIYHLAGVAGFGPTPLNPGNLPGGNPVGFDATAGFGADVDAISNQVLHDAGVTRNGIDAFGDSLGIRIRLNTDVSFLNLAQGLQADALRIGLHVRSIGAQGDSDSFVSNGSTAGGGGLGSPVPLPAAAWMFLTGFVGFLGLQRRRTAA